MSKILVVEDNEMLQEILVERLKLRNFEVVVAENGEEAITAACREKPDLILMDVSLPILDGWEATREIRSRETIADIPIIALTAHALAEDRDKSLEAGCDDFETKPVNLAQLLVKIEALLSNR